MANRKIGILGLSGGAGASFLTGLLAAYLGEKKEKKIAVLELFGSGLYDSLGMERHFAEKGFDSVYEAVRGFEYAKSLGEIQNGYQGINWALKTEKDGKNALSFQEKLRLLHNVQGDVLLCDFSGNRNGEVKDENTCEPLQLLREMQQVILVIDPLPSKLLQSYEELMRLRLARLPLTYVINKDNSGVHHKELRRYLKLPALYYLPCLAAELIYEAEYGCVLPYGLPGVKEKTEETLGLLCQGAGL